MRKMMPVARRVLNEGNDLLLMMRWAYGKALFLDDNATLDDLNEAVTTLEETAHCVARPSAARTRSGIEVPSKRAGHPPRPRDAAGGA